MAIPNPRRAAAIASAIGAAVALGTTALAEWLGRVEPHVSLKGRFGPLMVHTARNEAGEEVLVMAQGGAWQSVIPADPAREGLAEVAYYRVITDILEDALASEPHPHVLMIGGGACAWPRHALTRMANLVCEVVEADPEVVSMAERWFGLGRARERAGLDELGRPRLTVTVDDGRHHLEQRLLTQDAEGLHAVVNDAFRGQEAAPELLSPYGLALAKAAMAPGGLYLLNVVVPPDDPAPLLDAYDRLRAVFPHVVVVPAVDEQFSSRDNQVLVASDRELDAVAGQVL